MKRRWCLKCNNVFKSNGFHNQLCDFCRDDNLKYGVSFKEYSLPENYPNYYESFFKRIERSLILKRMSRLSATE